MDWKKLALSLVVGSSLAFVGCGDDGSGSADPLEQERVELPEPVEPENCDASAGEEYFYVINALDFAQADTSTGDPTAPGFNIDGFNTPSGGASGCGQMDYAYDIDQNGSIEEHEMGVDNALASLAGTLSSYLDLQEEVSNGSIVILARLEGVEDTTNDSCVTMSLLLGELPEGTTADELDEDEDGFIDPGATFEIDPASYEADGETPLIQEDAVIEDGRVMMGPVNIGLDIQGIMLNVENASVAFDVGETELSTGIIGGQLNIDALLDAVSDLLDGISPESIRDIIGSAADLDPVGGEDGSECESLSLGLEFGAVDAVDGGPADGGGGTDGGGTDGG
ncbi:MAG: hypothetical protein ACOCXM_04215 [Myxococcota bacterium]